MIGNILFSMVWIIAGLIILYQKKFSWKGREINLDINYIYLGLGVGLIIIGFIWLYTSINSKIKSKQEKYTICPTCQESFKYEELKNGKCKYCDDVDTVDIEEYYKKDSDK